MRKHTLDILSGAVAMFIGIVIVNSLKYFAITSGEKLILALISLFMILWGLPNVFGTFDDFIIEYIRKRQQNKLDKEFGIKRPQ